jgi:hypothetical protein
MVHVPLMLLSEWRENPWAPCLANLAHEQSPLSNDTIYSILRHRQVGRAKDVSAPPRIVIIFMTKIENFDVLLTVNHSIYILVIYQLDAQNFCFTISLFHASTCFEHHVLIVRRSKFYYNTASGIIILIDGRPVHRLRESKKKFVH